MLCSLSRQLRCLQEAGVARDHATLLVPPGTADIFFPTDFQMLDRMYSSTAKAAGKGAGVRSDGHPTPDVITACCEPPPSGYTGSCCSSARQKRQADTHGALDMQVCRPA